jgi:hypothetical protein
MPKAVPTGIQHHDAAFSIDFDYFVAPVLGGTVDET